MGCSLDFRVIRPVLARLFAVIRLHVQLYVGNLSVPETMTVNLAGGNMFERCIYFNTNALARKLNAIWDDAFSSYDLTPPQAYLLRLVLAHPGMTQQAISQELQLNKSTVTRFVNQLEKKDLLVRTASEGDLRENVILPTEAALQVQKNLESLGDTMYQSMCDSLGKQNVKTFVDSVRLLNRKL